MSLLIPPTRATYVLAASGGSWAKTDTHIFFWRPEVLGPCPSAIAICGRAHLRSLDEVDLRFWRNHGEERRLYAPDALGASGCKKCDFVLRFRVKSEAKEQAAFDAKLLLQLRDEDRKVNPPAWTTLMLEREEAAQLKAMKAVAHG